VFDIERGINGQDTDRRLAVRQDLSAPLVTEMEVWMREQRAKLSRGHDLAWAFDYILKRWAAFTRFLDDGRIAVSPYLPKQQRRRRSACGGMDVASRRSYARAASSSRAWR
jgi:hypothetical protein